MLSPAFVKDAENDKVVVATSDGKLLAFPVADMPRLNKGKGNKMVQLGTPKTKSAGSQCIVVAALVVSEGETLQLTAGRRKLKITWEDLGHYEGERAKRGFTLPKGYQKVASLEVKGD